MQNTIPYSKDEAPVIGFLMITLEAEFDKSLKEIVKNRYRTLFDSYKKMD